MHNQHKAHTHKHTHTYTSARGHTHTHTNSHTHKRMQTHTHTHTHKRVWTHTHTHTHTHTRAHLHVHKPPPTTSIKIISGRIAQVVERRPLDREVRGWNPSHDTMALFLGQHYEFPQCGIIKEKLSLELNKISYLSKQTLTSDMTDA
jgi:uncharacterized DUF497 family protein